MAELTSYSRDQSVRLPKKAEVVARRIAAAITEQNLAPGTVMPNEPEMLAQFGVARSTLREALRLLETQGVLSLQAGRSPVVRRPTPDQLVNSLTLLLQFQNGSFETLLRGRVLFEPAIAAEAARCATEDNLKALRYNVEQARSDTSTVHERVHRELEFHRLVADATANPLASLLVATLATAVTNEFVNIHIEHDFTRELEIHEGIVEAMGSRDAERAESLMRTHLQELLTSAEQDYPALLRRPIRWM